MATINVNVADQTFPQVLTPTFSQQITTPSIEDVDEQPIPTPDNPDEPTFIAASDSNIEAQPNPHPNTPGVAFVQPSEQNVKEQVVSLLNTPEYIVASDLINQSLIEFKSPLRFRFIAAGSDTTHLNVDILNGGAENPPLIPQQEQKKLPNTNGKVSSGGAPFFGGPLDPGIEVPSKASAISLATLLPNQTFKNRQLFFTGQLFVAVNTRIPFANGDQAYPTPELPAEAATDLNLESVSVIASVTGNTFVLTSPLPAVPIDGQIIELLTREASQPIADVVLSSGSFFPETITTPALANSQIIASTRIFNMQPDHDVSNDAQPYPNTSGTLSGPIQPEHDVENDPQVFPLGSGTSAPHNSGTVQVVDQAPYPEGPPANVFVP